MVEGVKREVGATIRTSILALVAMLGVPAAVYFGLRGPLGVGTANILALSSSVIIALAIVALLLWHDE